MLKEIIRFEYPIEEIDNDEIIEKLKAEGKYKPCPDDVVAACQHMLEDEEDFDTVCEYYTLVNEVLSEQYYNLNADTDCDTYMWPDDEDSLYISMMRALSDIVGFYNLDLGYDIDVLNGIIEMKECYDYNKGKPSKDWKLTSFQKDWVLWTYNARENRKVPENRRDVYKQLIEEGCKNDYQECLEIKGYACYGGNEIYECDWYTSRDIMEKLFEKTGDPRYANTLGYIYYYGRCNKGIPEYEKAFQYYSIGAAFKHIESQYKIADMFLTGKGIIKSKHAFEAIITDLYNEIRPRFCMGEDACFADIALRYASIWEKEENYEMAYAIYLISELAIKIRMEKEDFFGNKKVLESIQKGLSKCKEELKKENENFWVSEIKTKRPFWINNFTGGEKTKASIERLSKNTYKMTLERKKKDNQGKALLSIPQFDKAYLTKKMTFEFTTEEPIQYICSKQKDINIDICASTYEDDETLCLYYNEKEMVKINAAEFTLLPYIQ